MHCWRWPRTNISSPSLCLCLSVSLSLSLSLSLSFARHSFIVLHSHFKANETQTKVHQIRPELTSTSTFKHCNIACIGLRCNRSKFRLRTGAKRDSYKCEVWPEIRLDFSVAYDSADCISLDCGSKNASIRAKKSILAEREKSPSSFSELLYGQSTALNLLQP